MNINIWNILIPAAAGIFGVVVGSLKPLIDWSIDKRKFRRDERRDYLKKLRETVSHENFSINIDFIHSLEYSRVRPYLSKEFIEFFENHKPNKNVKGRHAFHTPWLLDEIQRIEKKWGLL